jgi:hypothetical protein
LSLPLEPAYKVISCFLQAFAFSHSTSAAYSGVTSRGVNVVVGGRALRDGPLAVGAAQLWNSADP